MMYAREESEEYEKGTKKPLPVAHINIGMVHIVFHFPFSVFTKFLENVS